MSLEEYRKFIASRAPSAQMHGFGAKPINSRAKTHQIAALDFALARGKSAMFLDTGLGKSFIELEFARQCAEESGKPSLILTPLAVAGQMVREGNKFGIDARQIREQHEVGAGVMVANYERLPKLDPDTFGAIILDECFAKGTMIDTPYGKKHIEDIRSGDYIVNCAGVDVVSNTHRREVKYAVLVKIAGTSFISSPNHPIFTQRGWVGAQHLRAGDYALATGAAMRLVRGEFCSKISRSNRAEVLRDIMLSEMAHDAEGCFGEGAFAGSSSETRGQTQGLAFVRQPRSACGTGKNYKPQPVHQSGSAEKDFGKIEGHEARTFRAWGQWSRDDICASIDDGCAWKRMGSGVSVVTGPKEARISDLLQDRLWQPGDEDCDRGGWVIASRQEIMLGPEERRDDYFSRVDSIEVLKSGDNRLDKLRDEDGKLYFYDLGATRHPSYSVNGVLVHNSSILKSYAGQTRTKIQDAFKHTPYKMAATATPSPNDHTELGNHAEFLDVMRQQEMLSKWFINDTSTASQNWRLKGHADKDFWDFVASWARCATLPSDLGGDDTGYNLPLVCRRVHVVQADRMQNVDQGMLFRIPEMSATSFHAEKRLTLQERCRIAADMATHDKPVTVWCETNDESAILAKIIPGAVEVHGALDADEKERRILGFSDGQYRAIVTKPKLAGFGVNWQHCAHAVFASISFSYEQHYQAVRRSHRFGQSETVINDIIMSDTESSIWGAIGAKSGKHDDMKRAMALAMKSAQTQGAKRVIYDRPIELAFPEWVRTGA